MQFSLSLILCYKVSLNSLVQSICISAKFYSLFVNILLGTMFSSSGKVQQVKLVLVHVHCNSGTLIIGPLWNGPQLVRLVRWSLYQGGLSIYCDHWGTNHMENHVKWSGLDCSLCQMLLTAKYMNTSSL